MKATLETRWGKVTLISGKVPDDIDLTEISDRKQRQVMERAFYPLSFNEIQAIEFEPKELKFDNEESYTRLCMYLQSEGFLTGEGNMPSKICIPLHTGPLEHA